MASRTAENPARGRYQSLGVKLGYKVPFFPSLYVAIFVIKIVAGTGGWVG